LAQKGITVAFVELSGEQMRQLINAEQAYAAFREAEAARERHRGGMAWKQVKGREYLYRKVGGKWTSLGLRRPETELTYERFIAGRAEAKDRLAHIDGTVRAMAVVNRAMGLGRVPLTAARVLRRLDRRSLLGEAISVVGTNALFAYERMAAGHFDSADVATNDIDLLLDARERLGLVAKDVQEEGLRTILAGADATFQPLAAGSFRAVNAAGFMVDLIMPIGRAASPHARPGRLGSDPADMTAAEIEGLAWLQNCPQVDQTAIDERGFPLRIVSPDPRAFALHKLWLAERHDRDPLKRRRDRQQAFAVADVLRRHLPHLPLDDRALTALPAALRAGTASLLESPRGNGGAGRPGEW
jgi:hypothetical protein